MNRLWAAALSLALVWAVGPASAEEPAWRPARPSPPAAPVSAPAPSVETPAVWRPVSARVEPPPPPPKPAVSLGEPVRASAPPPPPAVVPARHSAPRDEFASLAVFEPPGPQEVVEPLPPPRTLPPPTPTPPAPPPPPSPPAMTVVTAEGGWNDPAAGCVSAESCEEAPRLYFQGEYLVWFFRDSHYPTLAVGSAGQPLFGGWVDNEARHGFRLTAGAWLDPRQDLAAEASGFFLFQRAIRFNSGSLAIDTPSSLWGVEANGRARLWGGGAASLDLLAGFRFLDLREALHFADDRPGTTPGSLASLRDDFETQNLFYGGQLGAAARLSHGPLTLDVFGKVALGGTRQVVDDRLAATATPGGLLPADSTSGRSVRGRFSVVPELGVGVGYQVTDAMRLWAGYDLLFWSGAARPGQQVLTSADGLHITPRPTLRVNDTSFWAQGLSCGVELRY